MAVATGSQIRPELSAVDYTPFLQAAGQSAQMQAQGIGAAVGGAVKGFESYVQNKEREKQAQGVIKAADVLSSGFEPILEKVDPRIATALQDLRTRISDPNLSTTERATAAKSFMEQAPTLLNAGVKFLDAQLIAKARTDELAAKAAEKVRKENIASAARNIAIGKPVTQKLTPDEENEAFVAAATMREKGQMTERVDKVVNGKVVPYQVTTNLLTGEVKESQIRESFLGAAEQIDIKNKEKLMDIGAKEYEKLGTDVTTASAQAELADQIDYAMEQGAVTGPFAEASAFVKSIAESVFGGDYNAAIQKLYVQGGKGLTIAQRREMAKGLGSMSDDDRKDFDKGLMSIKDPRQAVKYYVEVVRLNRERANARKAFANRLLADGKTLDVVNSELFKLKEQEPFISAIARERVFGSQTKTEQPPQTPKITPEQAKAEIERRKAEKAKQ